MAPKVMFLLFLAHKYSVILVIQVNFKYRVVNLKLYFFTSIVLKIHFFFKLKYLCMNKKLQTVRNVADKYVCMHTYIQLSYID